MNKDMPQNVAAEQKRSAAFIGLGAMGFPMAGHLQRAGYPTTVYNRSPTKASHWHETYQGKTAPTPAEAALNADLVFVCVGNDDDVREVTLGNQGVLATLKPGSILIDHTTASADLARELQAACQKKNIGFLDAPVSGGQAGAESGQLTIMAGGETSTFDSAQPMMSIYGKSVRLMGPCGTGQLTKMANQICIAGVLQGLSEALHFSDRAGLDTAAVIEAISQGAAQSWQMDNRSQTMIQGQFDFGFAVDWMRKDLGLVLDAASRAGASLPLTALVDQFYGDVQNLGGGRWDTSSLIERLRKLNA
ncbi:MAG: NAD(P)-dependent oxidoreductase [Luminiphilus sp.]|jgi:3-hydroxyisobutyrate dehydrogenase-like beta-hydroxyacid dehydrogenase|nr:NAD(P)-dependent oxidoreductase [Luminiphilus sp.]